MAERIHDRATQVTGNNLGPELLRWLEADTELTFTGDQLRRAFKHKVSAKAAGSAEGSTSLELPGHCSSGKRSMQMLGLDASSPLSLPLRAFVWAFKEKNAAEFMP